jgi:hypothetical protein
MTRTLLAAAFYLLVHVGSIACAQQPEFPMPQKEHQWLQQFVGQWDTQAEGSMGPDQPPVQCKGTMDTRMLGGFWVVNEMQADMMGTPMTGIQTIGYDPAKKKYVGTWVDSMMNHMWKYEGTVDATGKVLTLEAEGPNFMTAGKVTKFRDAYEFKSANRIVATSSMQDEDGSWVVFLTGEMTRRSPH